MSKYEMNNIDPSSTKRDIKRFRSCIATEDVQYVVGEINIPAVKVICAAIAKGGRTIMVLNLSKDHGIPLLQDSISFIMAGNLSLKSRWEVISLSTK